MLTSTHHPIALVRGQEDDLADARFIAAMASHRRRTRRRPGRTLGIALMVAVVLGIVGIFAAGTLTSPA